MTDAPSRPFPEVFPPCCMGAAVYGPERCTCWRPVYSAPHSAPLKAGPRQQRARMCADCAFRPGSPERIGDQRYALAGEDELEDLVHGDGTFLCHVGMRRVLRWEHPGGLVHEEIDGAYEPQHPPRKSDGSPPDVCAGWAGAKRRSEAEQELAGEERAP